MEIIHIILGYIVFPVNYTQICFHFEKNETKPVNISQDYIVFLIYHKR